MHVFRQFTHINLIIIHLFQIKMRTYNPLSTLLQQPLFFRSKLSKNMYMNFTQTLLA